MITVNSNGQPVSAAFAEAVAQPMVSYSCELSVDGEPLDCAITRLALALGGGEDDGMAGFAPGSASSTRLAAQLHGCAEALTGRALGVRIGVDTGGGEHEQVDVASLTVVKARQSGEFLDVEAVGPIAASMAAPVGLPEGWASASAIASAIASESGVGVTVGGFATTSQKAWVDAGMTCRQALSALALSLGGLAWEKGDGSVRVDPFPRAATFAPPPGSMTAHPALAEADMAVDGLTVTASYYDDDEEEEAEVSYTYGTGRVSIAYPHADEAWADALWANVSGYAYRPGTLTIACVDPRVEPCDMASVAHGDGTVLVPATSIQCTFDGGYFGTIAAPGTSEAAEDAGTEGPVTAMVNDAMSSSETARVAAARAQGDATRAAQAAATADAKAVQAASAASAAQGSADAAAQAASVADGKAVAASQAAAAAQSDATAAQASATRANTYAGAALDQLGVVQDVIGVLTWASEHGSFEPTQDTAVQDGKVYFTYDSQTGDYTPVIDPQVSQLATYYELSVDEAMESYIMAHLAVTQRGLWVLPSGIGQAADEQHAPGYKLLAANDGLYIYDGSGALVRSDTASGTDFSEGRAWHVGSDDAYILYTPASGGDPATIVLGGANVVIGSDRTLSELVAQADSTLVFEVSESYSGDTATLTAHVYRGGVDVASSYDDSCFAWYSKTESTSPLVPLPSPYTNGRTVQVEREDVGFGAAIVCRFTEPNDAGLLTEDDDSLTDQDDTPYAVRSPSGDYVRVSDLEVETTVFDTDKVMLVGAEDEHLVSIATLKETFGDGDYERLSNKPSIENVTLSGNRNFDELGIFQTDDQGYDVPDDYTLSSMDINALWASAQPIG